MTQKSELVVATWNLEWAPAQSTRGREIRERLAACNADGICVTEGQTDNLPGGGDIIASEADYGYPLREGRRKVVLWTRHKWIERDPVGSRHLPPSRFAAGILSLDQAEVRVVGVCIPWSAAHVSTGSRDRTRWQDHLDYLDGLGSYFEHREAAETILFGDFNQSIPRFRQPVHVAQSLEENILGCGLTPISNDMFCEKGVPLIDHICVSAGLAGQVSAQWPKHSGSMRLSDHTGILAIVRIGTGPQTIRQLRI